MKVIKTIAFFWPGQTPLSLNVHHWTFQGSQFFINKNKTMIWYDTGLCLLEGISYKLHNQIRLSHQKKTTYGCISKIQSASGNTITWPTLILRINYLSMKVLPYWNPLLVILLSHTKRETMLVWIDVAHG